MDSRQLIDMLGLVPHPEGGYYREMYRSAEQIDVQALPPRYKSPRALCTAICYLLTPDSISAIHRLESDEIFHVYLGGPVRMLVLYPDGGGEHVTLGHDLERGERVQHLAPKGVWQGLRLASGAEYALLGTTVAPGFEYEDFSIGRRDDLIAQYPDFADEIRRLTH